MEISDEEITKFQAKLAQNLHEDRSSGDSTCDLVLVSKEKEFRVHKNVLMVSSKYFKTMLTTEMKEKYSSKVEIQQIPPDRLSNIIDYIYTGRITVNQNNMLVVYEDADYTQLEDLKLRCSNYAHSVISVDNCLQLLCFAKKHSLVKIMEKCIFTIAMSLTQVVQMPDFLHLDLDVLIAVIQQTPKTSTKEVFEGIVQWVNYSPDKREEYFENLFFCVDLSFTSPDFLSEMAKQKLVGNNVNCLKKICDAIPAAVSNRKSDSGKILIMSGKGSLKDCVQYDIVTRQSQQFPKLKTNRCYPASVKVEQHIYVIGGAEDPKSSISHKSCEVLDLNEPTEWKVVSHMLQGRDSFGAAVSDGCIYVVGGYNNGRIKSCEKFDIKNDKWTRVADIEHARDGHGLVFCQGLLYCIGGFGNNILLTSCECYDIANDKWTENASLNQARNCMACVVLNGYIYAIGGKGKDGNSIGTVERYILKDKKWEFVAPLKYARHGNSACVVGGRIVVVGGTKTKSVEVYDPDSDTWTDCFETNVDFMFATVQSL